jgi:beta-galactosidase
MYLKQKKHSITLKKGLSILLSTLLLSTSFPEALAMAESTSTAAQSKASVTAVVDDGTRNMDFNDNWQFYLATRTPTLSISNDVTQGLQDPAGGPTTAQIIDPSFDDSSWRTLNVPHDWSIEGQKAATNSDSQGYLSGGLGWYRKTFTLPDSMRGKKISIDFDGIYCDSIVYVNGNKVGEYPNGYTGFSYDISKFVTFGTDAPNVIAVKVQNMAPSGRWYTGSGITRPVHLVVTNTTRFMREGVTYTTPNLSTTYAADKHADFNISADIFSDSLSNNMQIRTTVLDADGKVAATHTNTSAAGNSGKTTLTDSMSVPNVHLWSIEDPYLYTIREELLAVDAEGTTTVIDTVNTTYGFRWFNYAPVTITSAGTYDANSGGFYLNGKYTKIQGVDLHADDGALGAATNKDALMRKFKTLKAMGINAYRTSHNPPAREAIQVCEQLGIVVMEEAFDGWGSAKATYDFGKWFLKDVPTDWAGSLVPPTTATANAHYMWSDWVIQEMVNRDKNSPAIIQWSIGNEIPGAGTAPSWMTGTSAANVLYGYNFGVSSETVRLKRDVLAADPTRYVVMGTDKERNVPSSGDYFNVNNILNGVGLNYNTAQSVDGLMNKFPNTFFFESESSSETSARGVYQDPSLVNTGVNQTPGSRGTSSYDNNMASWCMANEYGLKKDRDRKPFAGEFIWSGFDYIGEPTPYSIFPVGVSSFGTVDTAGFPKDSYYLFQSQWSSKPMAHLVPMDWTTWRPGETVEVWVNTNQQSAELYLNGKSLGRKSFDIKTTNYGKEYYETSEPTLDDKLNTSAANKGGYLSPNGSYGKLHFTWQVPFTPGTLEVKTYADPTSTVVTATDVQRTAGEPYAVKLTPDKEVITADGRSLSYVEATIVDKDGNVVPNANNLVKFDITGGAIVGVDNGQQENSELYKWGNVERNTHSQRTAYNGKVLCIIQSNNGQTGQITLKASFDGSMPSQATVFAVSAETTGSVGTLPINISVMKNGTLSLPKTAVIVNANGTTSQSSELTWTNVPATDAVGTFKATASVNDLSVVANITVYDFVNASITVPVPAGFIPILPANVKVNFSSGLSAMMPVTWPAITQSQVSAVGSFTLSGQITGLPNQAAALIKVLDNVDPNTNLALKDAATGNQDTASATGPIATASFTGGTSYPNLMLDGNTTSGGWTNKYNISATGYLPAVNNTRPYEFVQVSWPGYQTFNSLKLYFTTGGSAPSSDLPKSLDVQYFDGLKWVSAANQAVIWTRVSNRPTTIKFDNVTAAKVRVIMENATPYSNLHGAVTITEFQAFLKDPKDTETVLGAAIGDAETLMSSKPVGTAIGAVPQSAVDLLQSAIDKAKAVAVNPSATQAEIDAQVAALNAEITNFMNAVITGTAINAIVNPGFESGTTGWTISDSSAVSSSNPRTGTKALGFWKGSDFTLTASQKLTGLQNGTYSLSAWSEGAGGENVDQLFAIDSTGTRLTADIKDTAYNVWTNPTINNILVSDGTLTIGVYLDAKSGNWGSFDDFQLIKAKPVLDKAALTADKTILGPKNTAQLTVSGTMSNGTPADLGSAQITYKVDNPDVASVSSAGVVTPVKEGKANVTATVTIDGVTRYSSVEITVDTTAPAITVSGIKDGEVIRLNQKEPVIVTWSASDEMSGVDSATGNITSGSALDVSKVGKYTLTFTAVDKVGNTITKTITYYVQYNYSGLLAPISKDGSSSFKQGSTVPVKLQLKDANGVLVTDAAVKLYVAKVTDGVVGPESEAVSTAALDGNSFRYDSTSNQYIFNLNTKDLTAGTIELSIELGDGSNNVIQLKLK